MSRFSPTEQQYCSHAEGDGAHHSREAFHEISTREIRDDSLRLSCQTKALRSESALKHRAHCDDRVDHVQMEPDHGLCRGELSNHGTRSSGESRHNDDSNCWSVSLMPRTRESQGDGFTCDSRRVANTRDHTLTDCHDKKLKAITPADDSMKRQRKHSQSSDERDSKSSCKCYLDGFNVSTCSKGKTYSHPKHNDFEENEWAERRKKNGKSHSNMSTGRKPCPAKEDAHVGGLTIQGNDLWSHKEEGVCSELISTKSTNLRESHDLNVLTKAVPENGAGISRQNFHSHETVNVSRPDKSSGKSDSCPSDCSVSEIHLISQADVYSVTTPSMNYHNTVAANSKRATDVLVNSNNTSHFSHARMNQAEHNLYSDTKHRSELNVPKEKIEYTVEKAAIPSEGAPPTYESRLTDHSQCSDATLPTVTAAVQQLPEGASGEPPITKLMNHTLPLREAEYEELHTAAFSADDLKVKYTVPQDSPLQYSHANENKWTFDYEWLSGECIPETKALEATSHKEQNVCTDTQSYVRGEGTSVIGRKRTQPTKSPRKGYNFEAKACVTLGKAVDITADRKSNSQESVQLDESDTETLDSKSRRLLNQLQMVQICKRKANVLLKHVQSIIDGSHNPRGNTKVKKSKGPRASSTNQEQPEDEGSFKFEHKPRPKSESPDRLRREPYGKALVVGADVDSQVAATSDKLPVETLAPGRQSSNPNAGFKTQETSVHAWTDCTKEMKDKTTARMLMRSEFTHGYQGEEMYEYYKSKSPNTFICETTKHPTVSDAHIIQHRQLPVKGEKYIGPSKESELKTDQRCFGDKPTEKKNRQAREANSRKESPNRTHPTSKYAQWMSATAMQGSVSPTIYYENVSNTSESVDSVSVYDEVGSARYQNSKNVFAKDDKYYLLMRKRGTHTFTRSRSATAHTTRRQSGLHYHPKMSAKDKRREINRSSMRQSLKEAIKSAKQSISAAAKVAEALSFVVKASTDSSTSLSSEAPGKRPVWKQRHHSRSPAAKGELVDNLKLSETACHVAPPPPFNGLSVWPDEEEALYARPFQENIEQRTYRHEQKRLPSSLPQRLKAVNHEAKSSAATFSRNDPSLFYHKHFNSGQNLRDTETNPSGTPHAVSHGQAMRADSSPHTWDGAGDVTKYFTFEGARIKDGPVLQPVAEESLSLSPKITVQITISKSPDPSPKLNMNYLVDQPMHRKENPTQDTCHLFGHKSLGSQKLLSEYEQSSELTLSKENWTASHSCSSSTRKTNSYFNEVNPVEDRLLCDYGSSTRRVFRRQTMNAFVDGSANNVIGDSAKHNANVNMSPIDMSSMQDLTQNAEQIKMGEASQALSTTNSRLSLNRNRRTTEQHRDSFNQECNGSEVILSHHPDCPMNSLPCPSKRPKHSKADLCLSRSYKRSNRATCRGKVNTRNKSLSNEFNEKAGKTGEYQYRYDAKGQSPEIGIPVCYSDPSSPCVYNREFQGLSTSYSGELRTMHETCSHIRQGKSRRCSSINRQYSMQEMSPRGAFFPSHYRPELPATAGSRKSILEYESEHSQTTVYMDMEPTFLVHSTKIKAVQIPHSGVFPFPGTHPSSIEFTAICDKVLPAGDGKETPPSWDKLPHCQINNLENNNNWNNNNNAYVGKDGADDKMADHVSDTRECLVIDHVTTNKMVTGSRMGLALDAILPITISLRHDCDGQRRPVLTTLENLTYGSMCNITAESNMYGHCTSPEFCDRIKGYSCLKDAFILTGGWLKTGSLIISCQKINATESISRRSHLLPRRCSGAHFMLGRHGSSIRL